MFANANGEVYTYTYNADGIRTRKTVYDANGDFTGSTEYIYDGTKLIAESRSGDWLYYFYDANGAVTGMSYGGTLYYFRKNLQGDVTGIYNAYGTLVVEYEYTPYGALLSTTGSMATTIGTINPIRYRGYYYDTETELYYLITRYYDPEVGRFLNADAYASTGQGILGNNMFAYCLNNPVMMSDHSGYCPADFIGPCAGKDRCPYYELRNTEDEKENTKDVEDDSISNRVIRDHVTEPITMLDGGPLIGKVGLSKTTTIENEEPKLIYGYSDFGNDANYYGGGINVYNWLGVNTGVSTDINGYVGAQLTPWVHGSVSLGLDGLGVGVGIDVGNTSYDFEIKCGLLTAAAAVACYYFGPQALLLLFGRGLVKA